MPFYQIKLPVFEGPLDLLLRLIEREELDITVVALAKVTDQYLQRLADLEQRDVRDLADFLVVAAKLVLIKSAALLPNSSSPSREEEAEEAGRDLVQQLQLYSQYKQIAGLLHEREKKGLHSYVRLVPPRRLAPDPDLSAVTIQDLISLAQEALHAVPGPPVAEVVSPVTVTIEEQIDHIEHELSRQQEVSFRTLLSRAASRLEVIVTLLAVLELIKQDRVRVHQQTLFGEIVIQRLPKPSTNPDSRDANQAA